MVIFDGGAEAAVVPDVPIPDGDLPDVPTPDAGDDAGMPDASDDEPAIIEP